MAGELRIDSHKLMYHPCHVGDWLNGKNIYPLGIEVGLSSTCNHRCTFCALDYLEYQTNFLDESLLLKNLEIMKNGGLKSVVFAGEGEPLLHKKAIQIFNQTKELGLDVAMSTNAVLMSEIFVREAISRFTWIRFSIAAYSDLLYQQIHKAKSGDLEKVYQNIQFAVEYKKKNKLDVTLGIQLLMIPENVNEVVSLGKKARELGVDYYTVKPYSHHPESFNTISKEFDYNDFMDIEDQLNKLETKDFNIMFRRRAMEKITSDRGYNSCLGLPFFTYMDASTGIWPCIAFLGKEEYCYGKLTEMDFDQLWSGDQRKKVIGIFEKQGLKNCRDLCRLDEINKYLAALKSPGPHVNFI